MRLSVPWNKDLCIPNFKVFMHLLTKWVLSCSLEGGCDISCKDDHIYGLDPNTWLLLVLNMMIYLKSLIGRLLHCNQSGNYVHFAVQCSWALLLASYIMTNSCSWYLEVYEPKLLRFCCHFYWKLWGIYLVLLLSVRLRLKFIQSVKIYTNRTMTFLLQFTNITQKWVAYAIWD